MKEENPYADILHCPHPISTRHAAMTKLDRAAQFAPFAALTGYEEAISQEAWHYANPTEDDDEEAWVDWT